MRLPPYGLCLPCTVVDVRDGDTVVVRFHSDDYRWPLRLQDCWAPETSTAAGRRAKLFAQELIDGADRTSVFLPLPPDITAGEPLNLIKELFTFDRAIGFLFLDSRTTLNEEMVRSGHATKAKAAGIHNPDN